MPTIRAALSWFRAPAGAAQTGRWEAVGEQSMGIGCRSGPSTLDRRGHGREAPGECEGVALALI